MLKLLLGGSGSGKTTLLYQRIRARAEAGEKSILLVPEQFTSSTEGRIHRELGDALSGLVESFSFTSLAEHILSAEGGSAVQTLSDAGRAVLVRRALEELQDNVHYYYRHRRSAAFCQMAAETIDELKSAGLSGRQLYELAQDCGTDSAKLSELALIFEVKYKLTLGNIKYSEYLSQIIDFVLCISSRPHIQIRIDLPAGIKRCRAHTEM